MTAGDAIVIVEICEDEFAELVAENEKLLASVTVVTVYAPKRVMFPINVLVVTVNVDPAINPWLGNKTLTVGEPVSVLKYGT